MKRQLGHANWERTAYVYVRQSTAHQILEHTESTKRQYGLVERARALGWSSTKITVIDEDQGKSGASVEGREGFQRLVDAVVKGDAGAILAVEVSRLSRSSEDWRRLLGLCGVAGVAVIDEQAIYEPSDPDDKLLLDLKGTMSEAELHWLGLRLMGARRQKARRGELEIHPPTGYVWRDGGLALDPDEAVVRAIRTLFERFRVEPSATALMRWAHEQRFQMPTRRTYGDITSDEVVWKPVQASRLYWMLHNPIYAGTYAYGRCMQLEKIVDGRVRRVVHREHDPTKWIVVKQDAHPGYITWKEYLHNQDRMRQNMARMGSPHRGAPREGPALLNGLLVCGRCGRRMMPAYSHRDRTYFSYRCDGERHLRDADCWTVPGAAIDLAIEDLFLATMVPDELELCLAVERDVVHQASELDRAWQARIEQATYQARRAERRYKAVDPDNRVVARSLERDWEMALRALDELEREHERARREKRVELSDDDRRQVRALAKDLPEVWRASTTTPADRKAMLRIAIEAIGIRPVDVPRRVTALRVQWKSGQISELDVARPTRSERLRTPAAATTRLRELANEGLRDEQMADALNAEGFVTGMGMAWTSWAVKWARRSEDIDRHYKDLPRCSPLPARHPDGRYSIRGAAEQLGVSVDQVRRWMKRGLLEATREDFERYHGVYWIRLDAETTRRLAALSPATRNA
jgi:DNA invertase Pin-like site-specific DNA recombinase